MSIYKIEDINNKFEFIKKGEFRMNQILQVLEQEVKSLFQSESSGHDIYHLKRTLNLALHLHEKEGGNKLVIAVSVFLHDVHRIIQKETGQY